MSSDASQPVPSTAINIFFLSTAAFVYTLKKVGKSEKVHVTTSTYRIGSRGVKCLQPALPHLGAFIKCCEDPCHPIINPSGYIALCVAENKLIQERLALRLMPETCSGEIFSDSVAYCYSNMLGLPGPREAVARFLTRKFLLPVSTLSLSTDLREEIAGAGPRQKVNPQHVAFIGGSASVLSNIFFALCEVGDAVLIPVPYYNAFENDMKIVAGCVPFPVYMDDPTKGPSYDDLEFAVASAAKRGFRVKVLLLTNPNNPLGIIYPRKVMSECVKWARSKGLHTICDELYALSTHSKQHSFESVLKILDNNLGDDVHMIWALSKDFGASGFRTAFLCTQNAGLMKALENLNIFSCVSHPIQLITSDILSDDDFVDSFLEDSRMLVVNSKKICERKLDEMIIPYVRAEAGIFIYADFSALFPQPATFLDEARFSEILQNVAHLVITPGSSQRDLRPGMFRICFTWVSQEVLEIAMERLSYVVSKLRKLGRFDWDDITDGYFNEVTKCGIRKTGNHFNLLDI